MAHRTRNQDEALLQELLELLDLRDAELKQSREDCTNSQADLHAAIAQATIYVNRYEDAIAKISEAENDRIVALEERNAELQRALSEAIWEKSEYQLEVEEAREELEEKTQDLRALQRKHASVLESLQLLEARTEELETLAQSVIPVKTSRTTTNISKGRLTFSRSFSVVLFIGRYSDTTGRSSSACSDQAHPLSSSTPYGGPRRRLILAIDVGTTFSGISYCILDPGVVPIVQGVNR